MIISIKKNANISEVKQLIAMLESKGVTAVEIQGSDFNVFGLTGDTSRIDETSIKAYEDDFECDGDCTNCHLDDYEYGLDELKTINPKPEFIKQGHKPKTETIKMDDDMKGFSISTSDDYGYSSFSSYSTDEDLVRKMLKNYKKF